MDEPLNGDWQQSTESQPTACCLLPAMVFVNKSQVQSVPLDTSSGRTRREWEREREGTMAIGTENPKTRRNSKSVGRAKSRAEHCCVFFFICTYVCVDIIIKILLSKLSDIWLRRQRNTQLPKAKSAWVAFFFFCREAAVANAGSRYTHTHTHTSSHFHSAPLTSASQSAPQPM